MDCPTTILLSTPVTCRYPVTKIYDRPVCTSYSSTQPRAASLVANFCALLRQHQSQMSQQPPAFAASLGVADDHQRSPEPKLSTAPLTTLSTSASTSDLSSASVSTLETSSRQSSLGEPQAASAFRSGASLSRSTDDSRLPPDSQLHHGDISRPASAVGRSISLPIRRQRHSGGNARTALTSSASLSSSSSSSVRRLKPVPRVYHSCHSCKSTVSGVQFVSCQQCGLLYCGRNRCMVRLGKDWQTVQKTFESGVPCPHCRSLSSPSKPCINSNCQHKRKKISDSIAEVMSPTDVGISAQAGMAEPALKAARSDTLQALSTPLTPLVALPGSGSPVPVLALQGNISGASILQSLLSQRPNLAPLLTHQQPASHIFRPTQPHHFPAGAHFQRSATEPPLNQVQGAQLLQVTGEMVAALGVSQNEYQVATTILNALQQRSAMRFHSQLSGSLRPLNIQQAALQQNVASPASAPAMLTASSGFPASIYNLPSTSTALTPPSNVPSQPYGPAQLQAFTPMYHTSPYAAHLHTNIFAPLAASTPIVPPHLTSTGQIPAVNTLYYPQLSLLPPVTTFPPSLSEFVKYLPPVQAPSVLSPQAAAATQSAQARSSTGSVTAPTAAATASKPHEEPAKPSSESLITPVARRPQPSP